jgi:hypothetical protein
MIKCFFFDFIACSFSFGLVEIAASWLLDLEIGVSVEFLFLLRRKLMIVKPEPYSRRPIFRYRYKANPKSRLAWVWRIDLISAPESFEVYCLPGLEAVANQPDVRQPDVFHLITLDKGFFYLKILLSSSRVFKCGNKLSHCFPCLLDGALHGGVVLRHLKYSGSVLPCFSCSLPTMFAAWTFEVKSVSTDAPTSAIRLIFWKLRFMAAQLACLFAWRFSPGWNSLLYFF